MKAETNKTRLRNDLFYTFDIETTTLITGLDADSNPIRNGIIWSGQFFDGSNYDQVRSLREVISYLQAIEKRESDMPFKIAIFVHHLSYEFQFIKDFFKWEKILCTSQRKIISAETDKLVFRCTYFLSNMSLEKFLQAEKVPEEFQKSHMDYNIERFPWTEIPEDDYIYCRNDVVGLHMAVSRRIEECYNNDINNLPLTSTGYVRKDCRKACASNPSNRYRFYKEQLDVETFNMCHDAFRGGNTHANKMYANKVVHNVRSRDISSSYPFELLTKKFPTKFFNLKPFKQKEFDFFLENYENWAMLIDVTFENLELINPDATPVPYIPTSKANRLYFDPENKLPEIDNGRVLRCKYIQMVLTELDYMIIKRQYKFTNEVISRVKVAKKKYIMPELADTIRQYYYDKTLLKQDADDPNFDEDIDYRYHKSKNKLNGIYGMHVTNPVKEQWIMDNVQHIPIIVPEDTETLLEEYYNSFSNFLSYQVGVYVSAYARYDLQEAIDALTVYDQDGNAISSDLIYCDTDSCKYINWESHEEAFNKINERKIKEALEHNAYCDRDGKRYYLGIFDDEGLSDKFKTFGAKKYIYGSDDEFKITISGVPKKPGKELIKEAVKKGRLDSPFDIKKGFVFHGIKLTSEYNDYTQIYKYKVDGHEVEYASNVALYPSSYTLGLTYEYERLLNDYEAFMED